MPARLPKKILLGWLASLILGAGLLPAPPARAAARPLPVPVREEKAYLVQTGCEPVRLDDAKALQAYSSLDWQAVIPADAAGESLLFCPPAVVRRDNVTDNGRVAGLITPARAAPSWGEWFASWGTYFIPGVRQLAIQNDAIVATLKALFRTLAWLASWLISFFTASIVPLLTLGTFTEHLIVKLAWPVVLGFINMGFLLALVVIALLTTLRLNVGGGVRRLLPRLLIAALLVNFSLVIAGLIIDVSRVIMAVLPGPFGISIDQVEGKLATIAQTGARYKTLEEAFSRGAGQTGIWWSLIDPVRGWDEVLAALVNAILAWIMALALAVVVFSLLMRYIMLLLLLIISPIAYLAVAFPGLGALASRWWQTFMRYVIYGPVVLFIILGAINIDYLINAGDLFGGKNFPFKKSFEALMEASIYAVALVVAAMAGRYAGIIGSATAISLAAGAGRRARGMAYRGAKRAGRGAAKAAYVGTGARAGVRGVGRQARDFGRAVKGGVAAHLPTWARGVKRDKEGKPLKGQPRSWGERLGRRVTGGAPPADRREAQAAARVGTMPGSWGNVNNLNQPAVSAVQLSKRHVTEAIGNTGALAIAANSQKVSQVTGLSKNADLMRQLGDQGQTDLMVNIEANPHLSNEAKARLVNEVHNTIEKARGNV